MLLKVGSGGLLAYSVAQTRGMRMGLVMVLKHSPPITTLFPRKIGDESEPKL